VDTFHIIKEADLGHRVSLNIMNLRDFKPEQS
jgi:hypothetical protein